LNHLERRPIRHVYLLYLLSLQKPFQWGSDSEHAQSKNSIVVRRRLGVFASI
jgi:hypothetical protein